MTVVLVDPRRPSLIPVEAIDLLGGDVQYTEEMPVRVPWTLPAARPAYDGDRAAVLLSSDPQHPEVKARLAAGEQLIPAPDAPAGERLVDAVALMDKLRTNGPWESGQTHDSLRRFLLEETYELFDAVRSGNADELREELGDVLLQVLFHARIAEDAPQNAFTIDDVADSLLRKLANRVPGVLAGESISLEDQIAQWDQRKAAEKPRAGALAGVALALPALTRAEKLQKRAARTGFDWPDAQGPRAKIDEELAEFAAAADDAARIEEAGDLLFAVVNWLRHHGIDAEGALRGANAKFEQRFAAMEEAAGPAFPGLSLAAKEALWDAAKRGSGGSG